MLSNMWWLPNYDVKLYKVRSFFFFFNIIGLSLDNLILLYNNLNLFDVHKTTVQSKSNRMIVQNYL